MWKRVVLSICLVAACKDDSPAPTAPAPTAPAAPVQSPAARPRPRLDVTPPVATPDGSGAVDRDEMRLRRAERMRDRLDIDHDGKITVDELKNATGRMKFDDPAAIDTDHDGVISDEELAAAMKARRDKWRDHQGDK